MNTITTVSDSKGNTWTGLTSRVGAGAAQRLYYCLAPTVGTGHTFTVSGTSTAATIHVYAFFGVSSYHSESGATGSASPLASGSLTPSANGALVFTGRSGGTAIPIASRRAASRSRR